LLQDRLIGVLDLESTEANAFNAEHERMLATLGSFIAIAPGKCRLFLEARENELRLQEDLSTAPRNSASVIATGAREVPGNRSRVRLLFGPRAWRRFFTIFCPMARDVWRWVLGDVSGKGTAAALFGSLAIGTIREHIVDHPCSPHEMLAMLNNRLNGARLDSRFIATVLRCLRSRLAAIDDIQRRRTLPQSWSVTVWCSLFASPDASWLVSRHGIRRNHLGAATWRRHSVRLRRHPRSRKYRP
jgi:hypothetical protein